MTIDPLTPERRRELTREYLLTAAEQVFAERGFHGASLDLVAATAGFTKGAVYSNFKNKEDLFLAVLEANFDREMAALRATLEASAVPPEARLSDFVQLIRGQRGEVPGNWGVLYQEFCLYAMRNPTARDRVAELDNLQVRSIAEIIEAERARHGIEAPEPATHVARIIVALFRGIELMRPYDPHAVDEPFLETVLSLLARALVPRVD